MEPDRAAHRRVLAALLIVTLLVLPLSALGAPGDLDTTFDTDGIVTTPIGSGNDLGSDLAIQPDGKIVAVGTSHNGVNNDFALVRYNPDGSLDTGFDSDGIVTTDLGGIDTASAVALQPDGKIVVAGESNSPGNFDFTVVRYNADGSLDTGFGTGGVATTDFGYLHDRAYAVAVQTDGKIVLAGYARANSTTPVNNDIALVRYNADGSLDTTFDTDGRVVTSIGGVQDHLYGMVLQPDGKIVVVGYTNSGGNYDFLVVRYNTDGSRDTGFDTDGIVTTAFRDKDDFAYDVALQPDGKIVAAGWGNITTAGNHDDFLVARYNADGSLDTGFGTDGKVVTDLTLRNDHGAGVAIQGDGRILVTGYSTNATDQDFALVRYDTGGSLDTTFSTDGIVITQIGGSHEQGKAVAIQANSAIVVMGQVHNGTNYDFALARYEDVPSTPPVAFDDAGVDYTTDEETPFTTGNVLDNDTDLDPSDTLSVASFETSVLSGTLSSNGDGTFDYDPDGQFDYLSSGEDTQDVFTYVVTDGTYTDTATVTITITGVNDAPIVDAGLDQLGDEGEALDFSGNSTDPDTSAIAPAGESIAWDFGDGTVITGTLTPTHTYADDGVYTVTLAVTDTLGGVGQDSLQVTVDNVAPVVAAGPDASIAVGGTFTRNGGFTDPGADTWTATVDYGTGGGPVALDLVTQTFTLSHTYAVAGVYTVTVSVEDDDGGIGSDQVVVTVAPSADLEISQGLSISFFDTIFTIVARNNGPEPAPGAVVSVTFPVEITHITWTCAAANGASCAPSGSGNTIMDTLASFPDGGVVTYTVHTQVLNDALYYNAAEIVPPDGVPDPDLSNNVSQQATRFIVILPTVYKNAPAP